MIKMIKISKFNVWMMRIKDINNFRKTNSRYNAICIIELPLFSLELETKPNSKSMSYDKDDVVLIAYKMDMFLSNYGSFKCIITEDELKEINNVWNEFYEGKY